MSISRSLFDYLPGDYKEIRESNAILSAEQAEIERLNEFIQDIRDQYFVSTATWGLANWEQLVGIPPGQYLSWNFVESRGMRYIEIEGKAWRELDGSSETIDERRSNVLARMRGAGTITKRKIAEISLAYTGGEVEITERNSESIIEIKFTNINGLPEGIDGLKKVLREVLPAHLDVVFKYRYVSWGEFDNRAWTYGTLDANSVTWAEFEAL